MMTYVQLKLSQIGGFDGVSFFSLVDAIVPLVATLRLQFALIGQ